MKRFLGTCQIVLSTIVFLVTCSAQSVPANPAPLDPVEVQARTKAFEAAVSVTNTLVSWAFLVFGGTILVVVGTSYHRPKNRGVRWSYMLFLPAWGFLTSSIYFGSRVQGNYLASLLNKRADFNKVREALNANAASQIDQLTYGLFFLGVWIVVYLLWWILSNEESKGD